MEWPTKYSSKNVYSPLYHESSASTRPDMGGRGGEILGSTDGPHLGYNRNAYPYGLPPNFTPPTMHENVDHAIPITIEGQLPQPIGGAREEPQERAQVDINLYPLFTAFVLLHLGL